MEGVLERLRYGVRRLAGYPAAALFELRRRQLAYRYLRGSGLEIGALHRPLWVSSAASVRYVDRMDVPELQAHYPELAGEALVPVDVVDDGETLRGQADDSADFIIASHFLEHTQDPLGTLAAHARVLRSGGILYLAVPDRRKTFDRDRDATPLEHVIRDHDEGPAWSRRTHQEEWVRLVDKAPQDEVAERVRVLEEQDYSIHFHVWAPGEFRELLEHASAVQGVPFRVERLATNRHELIAILRKT